MNNSSKQTGSLQLDITPNNDKWNVKIIVSPITTEVGIKLILTNIATNKIIKDINNNIISDNSITLTVPFGEYKMHAIAFDENNEIVDFINPSGNLILKQLEGMQNSEESNTDNYYVYIIIAIIIILIIIGAYSFTTK